MKNYFKTFVLMVLLTLLFIWLGGIIAGKQGMIWAFIFASVMNFFSYWFSDKIVLMMYGAKEIKEQELPEIYRIVRELIKTAKLPMPKIYIINTPTPNAFATGRNPKHAAVAVTTGILNLLKENELKGVIAHELSHVKNLDTLISVIAATIAGAIFMLSRMAQWALIFGGSRDNENRRDGGGLGLLLAMIIAPIAAMLIQLAISRTREYIADESAARITNDPLGLASALRKITDGVNRIPMDTNPATSHMFIINPLRGKDILTLFSTHPPVSERIRRLENLSIRTTNNSIPNIIY